MAPRATHPDQMDLLAWQAPEVVRAFPPELVRGASFEARIARAVSVALTDCGVPRAEVADRMSGYLGQKVSLAMLNAYASAAREEHTISLPRFLALMHATGDQRLLELLAEPFGLAVVERKHLPLIEMALVSERITEMKGVYEAKRREARAKGGL